MEHWLEESEKMAEQQRKRPERHALKVEHKKQLIANNYRQHSVAYDRFIATLHNLVNRVNALPESLRQSFSKLLIKAKKSKLDNRLHILSSSRREHKRLFSLLRFLQLSHTKHIRMVYLYVSKQSGYIDFELKESKLERKRLDNNAQNNKADKQAHRHKHRLHVVFRFPVEKLDNDTGLQLIDWLVFKSDLEELNFWKTVPQEEKLYF